MENEVKEQELFIPKTKHKGLKIFLAILLIAGLGVGGYFLYQYKFNNPKTIVSNLLEDARKDVKESLVIDTSNDVYKLDGHVKLDTNLTDEMVKGIGLLKDIELQFSGEIDSKNSLANMNINTKYQSDKLIDLKAFYEKETIYLLLDGLYDKYLKVDAKSDELPTTEIPNIDINPEDVQTISEALIDAMKTEIEKLDLKKEDETITIDGKEMDVINNYVILKDNQVNDFANGLINTLSKNQKFTEVLKKLTGKDAKTILSEAAKEITEDVFKGTYKICFYTDKGIFNKKLVSVRQTIAQNNTSISINVDKISDDEIKVSVTQTGMTFSIKLKKNNSAINCTLSINLMGYYLNAEINTNYEKIKEVTKPDVSNNKNINDLTEAEQAEISKKLQDNKAIQKLIEAASSISGLQGA